jgi:3-hydroxyisobutyrate dehydrogenase-like beta-hydroxyacid dehydrogenase
MIEGRIALLGSGFMGTSVGKALLAKGCELHVWNRTAAKTEALENCGAIVHDDVEGALDSSDVIILLLADHATARLVIAGSEEKVADKDVLDLMTGGSGTAHYLAELIESCGGHYLDGVIANFPADIGTDEALVYVSGNEAAWRRRQGLLRAIAPATRYLGASLGKAAAVDAAMAGAFATVAMGAWMEALAFLSDANVEMTDDMLNLDWWVRQLARDMAQTVEDLRSGNYTTTEASLAVNTAALTQWRQMFVDRGHQARIMSAALGNFKMAEAAGLGDKSWSAQIELLRQKQAS